MGRALTERKGAFGVVALRAGAALSLVFIVLLIHRSTYSLVMKSPEFKLAPQAARATVAPSWADPAAGESVVVLPAGRDSLLDPDLVPRVAASFASNPWVRRVIAVERSFPDQVRVRLEMRTARLALRRAGGCVLVDRDGVRLPGLYDKAPRYALEVAGSASVPPAPGRVWEGPEIACALEMASLAESEPVLRALDIRLLDVANLNGRRDPKSPDLSLATAGGSVIGWGRAPSAARFGEPALSEKLDNLRRATENYPRLEGVASVKVHQRGPARLKPVDPGLVRRAK
ncbi:MAG TPA: hypothetical protein VFT32_12105 [Candidatus Eisenbacteria bacterium]|nr:hypothetical protein [Candidatus Eisenbacteria bacterium]